MEFSLTSSPLNLLDFFTTSNLAVAYSELSDILWTLVFPFHSLLQYLLDNIWVDKYTRAIFVEFTVYNANVNLFCIVTLMFETTAVGESHFLANSGFLWFIWDPRASWDIFCFTGAFQYRSDLQSVRLYQSTSGFHIFMMASEATYFLFILYYMFQQVSLLTSKRSIIMLFKIKYRIRMRRISCILFYFVYYRASFWNSTSGNTSGASGIFWS